MSHCRHFVRKSAILFFGSVVASIIFLPVSAFAWQGAGTKIFVASSAFVALQNNQQFFGGGPHIRFTHEEDLYICSMQKALPKSADDSLVEWLAAHMANIMGRDASMVTSALKDPAFCTPKQAVAPVPKAAVIVHLNSKGIVVSTNQVWNACVSGQNLTLDLLKKNEHTYVHRQGRISKEFTMTCRDYHRGDISMWQHPDYPGLEIQLDKRGRLLGGLPTGFIAKKDSKDITVKN